MMLVFALVVILGLATAGPTAPGCCTPPQWEGVELGVLGQVQSDSTNVTKTSIFISYDAINQKIAYIIEMIKNGVDLRAKILQDYTRQKQYVIYIDTRTCTTSDLPGAFSKMCLPAEAESTGIYYYGIGSNTFPVSAYKFFAFDTNITLSMTRDNCIPLAETTFSSHMPGSGMMHSVVYADLTVGIGNRTVFNIPPECSRFPEKPTELYPQPKIRRHGIFTHKLNF